MIDFSCCWTWNGKDHRYETESVHDAYSSWQNYVFWRSWAQEVSNFKSLTRFGCFRAASAAHLTAVDQSCDGLWVSRTFRSIYIAASYLSISTLYFTLPGGVHSFLHATKWQVCSPHLRPWHQQAHLKQQMYRPLMVLRWQMDLEGRLIRRCYLVFLSAFWLFSSFVLPISFILFTN